MNVCNHNLITGDVLRIFKFPVWHYGIYDGDQVLHASKKNKRIVRQSLATFLEGQTPQVINRHIEWSCRQAAIRFANSQLHKEYSLTTNNCEHFVNACYGNKHSKQLIVTSAALVILGLVVFFKKSR